MSSAADRRHLQELFRERAELADMESTCADAKKYMRIGGLLWRFFSWFERKFQRDRRKIQAEIDEIWERVNDHRS